MKLKAVTLATIITLTGFVSNVEASSTTSSTDSSATTGSSTALNKHEKTIGVHKDAITAAANAQKAAREQKAITRQSSQKIKDEVFADLDTEHEGKTKDLREKIATLDEQIKKLTNEKKPLVAELKKLDTAHQKNKNNILKGVQVGKG